MLVPLMIAGLLSSAGLSHAADEKLSEKSQFHLFNPTPRHLMRDLSTDRPDKTESAYTVDAGHYQLEMDIMNYAYDRSNTDRTRTRVETVAIAPMNLKVGLLNNLDLQLMIEPFTSVRAHELDGRGSVEHRRGFGDLTLRSKFNLWGNDGGATAMALMPFIKVPTNQEDLGNNSVEGGIIVPLAVALPGDWGMGVMTEVDFIRDEFGDGHHAEFINTITVGRGLTERLGAYIEFFSLVSAESDTDWVGTVDVGFTYALSDDIQLDSGVNIGVTRSADDINPFVGLAWRY